jgi:pyruvate kinase
MMARIAKETENSSFMKYNIQYERDVADLVTHAVAQSAVNISYEVDAKAIVSFSVSGKTSRLISKQRPAKPVYGFTPSKEIYNRLSLIWGITPFIVPRFADTKRLINAAENILLDRKLIKRNDIIIIVIGLALKVGSTNMIKIHKVGQED